MDAITIKKSNLNKIKKLIPIVRNISIEAVNENFQNHFYKEKNGKNITGNLQGILIALGHIVIFD